MCSTYFQFLRLTSKTEINISLGRRLRLINRWTYRNRDPPITPRILSILLMQLTRSSEEISIRGTMSENSENTNDQVGVAHPTALTPEGIPNSKTLLTQTKPLKINVPFVLQVAIKRADLEAFEKGDQFSQDAFIATQISAGLTHLSRNPKDLVRTSESKPGEKPAQPVTFALDHLTECALRKLSVEFYKLTRREIGIPQLANLALVIATEPTQS
jgi:hypothetical protein